MCSGDACFASECCFAQCWSSGWRDHGDASGSRQCPASRGTARFPWDDHWCTDGACDEDECCKPTCQDAFDYAQCAAMGMINYSMSPGEACAGGLLSSPASGRNGAASTCDRTSAAADIVCSLSERHTIDRRFGYKTNCYIQGAGVQNSSSCPPGWAFQELGAFKQCVLSTPALDREGAEALNECGELCSM